MCLDVDATVAEVLGEKKQGAAADRNGRLGYHPVVAARADTGEIVDTRLRPGASQQGNDAFITDAVAKLRGSGHTGEVLLRTDSGFFS